MSSGIWSVEVEMEAAPARVFSAAFTDWHNLGPKLVPDLITSITVISGDGSPGSIRQVNFTQVVPFGYVKERLEWIDREKLELKVSVVETGDSGKKLEFVETHFKVEPNESGSGSIVRLTGTYKTVQSGVDVSEDLDKAKQGFIVSAKAVEAYLLANPGAYA